MDNYYGQQVSGPRVKRGFFTMKDAGAGFMWAVLCLLAAQFILSFIWAFGTLSFGWPDILQVQKTSFAFLIISGFGLQIVLFLFYFIYTKKMRIEPFAAPLIKNMPARNWLLTAAAGVAALLGLMFTSFAFDILFTDVFKYQGTEVPGFDTAGRAVLGVIFMGIAPAIMEEIIFRGMVLRGLSGLGKWKAVLISAAAFTMTHMNPSQTVHQFFLGIILGLIAWETGSILAPMLIHFINNALAVVLEAAGFFGLFAGMEVWAVIVTAVVTFCAVCGIMYLILRFIKKPPGGVVTAAGVTGPDGNIVRPRLRDQKNALTFFIIGFIVTALMWLLGLVPADFLTGLTGG